MTTYLGKELFILFAASAFRKLSSIYVFSYFPFGFEGRIWDLIVSVPDHCLSFYFLTAKALVPIDYSRRQAPIHKLWDPCVPETETWHLAIQLSDNGLD